MKKNFLSLFLLVANCQLLTFSQTPNCADTIYGTPPYVPLNDLGAALSPVTNDTGGLYPYGSNAIPPLHLADGLALACQIKPLNGAGAVDTANGKIVFLSIGMSNTTMEFSAFIPMGNADAQKNPKVVLVDGAQGGQTAQIISTPSNSNYATFWNTVNTRLTSAGVDSNQVEAVWFKEADIANSTPIQTYSDSLLVRFKRAMNIMKKKFVNLKICYVASRIYAGYASSTLNPEPYAYWQGWDCKWLIRDQINGDLQLIYQGPNANSPWLAWGTYNWANGTDPRGVDSLIWICPTDFNNDGTHPSITGRNKVATKLLNFLDTAATACWYRNSGCNCSVTGINNIGETNEINIFPNPSSGIFTIQSSDQVTAIEIYNIYGEEVFKSQVPSLKLQVDLSNQSEGIYFLQLKTSEGTATKKIMLVK